MYIIIRIVVGFIIFVCAALIIKRTQATNKRKQYFIAGLASVAVVFALIFVPFENVFYTFDSPEKVYNYVNLIDPKVKKIIEGEESDFIIGAKKKSEVYLTIPKTEDGWEVGIGNQTKKIVEKRVEGAVIYVYRFKTTGDYYVAVFDNDGKKSEVTDSLGTNFFALEGNLDEKIVSYYANVRNMLTDYQLIIDGEKIALFEETEESKD